MGGVQGTFSSYRRGRCPRKKVGRGGIRARLIDTTVPISKRSGRKATLVANICRRHRTPTSLTCALFLPPFCAYLSQEVPPSEVVGVPHFQSQVTLRGVFEPNRYHKALFRVGPHGFQR